MSVPTIGALAPASGHTGGGLVRITGTNFRQQTAQVNATGPLPVPPPSVEVFFGSVKAPIVRVLSPTRLEVYTPKSDAGVVSVIVRNIDDDGVLIGAESVTALAAYSFQLPDLTVDQYPTRAIAALIATLRREILAEVVPLAHSDFDDSADELNITVLAKIPALVLLGPRLLPAPGMSANSATELDDGTSTGTIDVYQRSAVKHMQFRLIGVTDNHREMLNLLAITQRWFSKAPFVLVDKDPSNASAGQNTHPVFLDQEFEDQSGPNDSNLRQFRGSFIMHGIYFESIEGFTKESRQQTTFPADTVTLEPSVEIEV